MRKSDLKNGMILELRNGDMCIVIGDKLLDLTTYMDLVSYNDNLTCTDTEFDVIRVYENKDMCGLDDKCNIERLNLIWERKEIDWSKVPFGTRVKCWDYDYDILEGKFIRYKKDEDLYKFEVFVEGEEEIGWRYCELIEEPITRDEVKKSYIEYLKEEYLCSGEDIDYEEVNVLTHYIFKNYNVTRK